MSNVRDAALQIGAVLESMGISYAIGGSFASSVHGVARPTQDLDFVAAILPPQAEAFAAALQRDFYVNSDAIQRGASLRVVHFATGFKFDIVPAGSGDLAQQNLKRCRFASSFPVISAEDTILVKLRWYRDGGESSERQWNDLRNIVKVQGDRLDLEYLHEWSRRLNVSDLLAGLLSEEMEHKNGGQPDDHHEAESGDRVARLS